MHPVNFDGARVIGKPNDVSDEQCFSVWATSGIDNAGFPYFCTAWKPSYEDMQALNRGEPIYIKTICMQLPMMAVFTTDENGNPNDAG